VNRWSSAKAASRESRRKEFSHFLRLLNVPLAIPKWIDGRCDARFVEIIESEQTPAT
jgi:hypothetical protein